MLITKTKLFFLTTLVSAGFFCCNLSAAVTSYHDQETEIEIIEQGHGIFFDLMFHDEEQKSLWHRAHSLYEAAAQQIDGEHGSNTSQTYCTQALYNEDCFVFWPIYLIEACRQHRNNPKIANAVSTAYRAWKRAAYRSIEWRESAKTSNCLYRINLQLKEIQKVLDRLKHRELQGAAKPLRPDEEEGSKSSESSDDVSLSSTGDSEKDAEIIEILGKRNPTTEERNLTTAAMFDVGLTDLRKYLTHVGPSHA